MFCQNCGRQLEEGAKSCPDCGAAVKGSAGQWVDDFANQAQGAFDRLNNTEDTSYAYSHQQISDGKVMGILAYISFLVLVPIFAEKENPFVRYHANQGLVLFLVEIIYAVLRSLLVRMFFFVSIGLGIVMNLILSLLSLVFVAYMVIGIVNVCYGKAKQLPIIGNIILIK